MAESTGEQDRRFGTNDAASFASAMVRQIRAVHLALTPWTVEAGLLTPTLKVKRDALQRKFAKEIEALYAER